MTRRLASNIKIEGETFISFPIDVAIEYSSNICSGFYLPLGPSKRIKIEHEAGLEEKLTAYKEKGLKNILFSEPDYQTLMSRVKTGLSMFFFKDMHDKKLASESQMLECTHIAVSKLGISTSYFSKCDPLMVQTINWIKSSSHLAPIYKQFINDCPEQFVFQMVRSYLSIALADALELPKHLAEKFIQINLLSDLMLKREDFDAFYMNREHPDHWSPNYKNHPKEMVKLLERYHSNTIPKEVLKAIDQHEENPDGTGFPYAMDPAAFDKMVSIVITARLFVQHLITNEYSYQDRKRFLDDFVQEKLSSPFFKNKVQALYTILELGDNDSD